MMLGSVSQQALHDRKLRFLDHRSAGWSLFPFFDEDGQTQAFMLTNEADGRITLIDFQERLLTRRALVPRMGAHRVGLQHAELADSRDAQNLASLWHFDPWWELGATRYRDHPAVPTLKATNLVGHDPKITGIWFDRTLSEVHYVGFGEGQSLVLKRFKPDHLTTAQRKRGRQAAPAAEPARPTGWRLNPFWERA